ncbi:MAG: ATP-binding protein [Acidimicrobiia bacterium]|nr:ATP-binding protein [Acidimicrobiia bacterium]MCY4456995.1 ATP-binding protein [Acidimicrobiaceae bacterium]
MHNTGMPSGELTLETDHLDRLVTRNAIAGLNELVWNSLDAEATRVSITVELTGLGAVDKVIVSDNGHGFAPDEVNVLMSSLGGSWKATKANRKTKRNQRFLHGKKGEGRFQAFCLGDHACWESVAEVDGTRHLTNLTISRPNLKMFDWNSQETERPEGTTVTVSVGSKEISTLAGNGSAIRLLERLALYLTQYPEVEISFNNELLDPTPLIDRRETLELNYANSHGRLMVSVIE